MRDGKVSYIQIPALDTVALGRFYGDVFGWTIASGTAGHVSFEDASGELIGAFVTQWPVNAPGIVPYISVDDVSAALEKVKAAGGSVEEPRYAEGSLWVARFRDPQGNVLGMGQMS